MVELYEKEYVDNLKERGVDLTFYGNWQRDFGQLVMDLLDPAADVGKRWESMLDVGCATGLNMRAIDKENGFARMYGIDVSEYMTQELTRVTHEDYKWNADTVEFYVAASHDMPMIKDGDIDFIMCTQMLEHVLTEEYLHATMVEFDRVLHEGGKIVVIMPILESDDQNYDKDHVRHNHMHTSKWWSSLFGKYFKSESFKAKQIFKKTELKPDRSGDKTFPEVYFNWGAFRLVKK